MKKKESPTMEFLMTWGWFILAVIVIVCVIAYLIEIQEPDFRIYKEECRNETVFEDEYCIRNFSYFSCRFKLKEIKICERVEVDEILSRCKLVPCYKDLCGEDKECQERIRLYDPEGVCDIYCMKKQDLSIEWLEENCECYYGCMKVDNECLEGCRIECPTCDKYVCGEYSVEVLE